MPEAARLNDSVAGTTAGEHSGHVPPHSPEPFGGQISSGCSGNVFINGRPAGGDHRKRHHGDGRLLRQLPGGGGRRERLGQYQRKTGCQEGRRPGSTQRLRGGSFRELRCFHRGMSYV